MTPLQFSVELELVEVEVEVDAVELLAVDTLDEVLVAVVDDVVVVLVHVPHSVGQSFSVIIHNSKEVAVSRLHCSAVIAKHEGGSCL